MGGELRHLRHPPRIERRKQQIRVVLPTAQVLDRKPRLLIRPHEQREDLLTHAGSSPEWLGRLLPPAERGEQIESEPFGALQVRELEGRVPVDVRPALAEHRHQRQHVARQASVAPLTSQAGECGGVDPARIREHARLAEQLLAQGDQVGGERRDGLTLGARGAIAGVRVLQGDGVAGQTIAERTVVVADFSLESALQRAELGKDAQDRRGEGHDVQVDGQQLAIGQASELGQRMGEKALGIEVRVTRCVFARRGRGEHVRPFLMSAQSEREMGGSTWRQPGCLRDPHHSAIEGRQGMSRCPDAGERPAASAPRLHPAACEGCGSAEPFMPLPGRGLASVESRSALLEHPEASHRQAATHNPAAR